MDTIRKLALDAIAYSEWGYGDLGERVTATLPVGIIDRLCRLAGFQSIPDAEAAIQAATTDTL